MEHRTEAAAQRMTVVQVEIEVQHAVQMEERDRIEKDYRDLLLSAMQDER